MIRHLRCLFRLLLPAVLLWAAGDALAAKRIDPRAPTFTTTWTGGNLTIPLNWCVASTDSNNVANPPLMNYTLRVLAPYNIASGANTVPVTMSWVDLAFPATSYPLTAGSYVASNPFTGQLRNCPTLNPNARLNISIAETDLTGKPPGTYTRTFTVDVENARGGGGPDTTTFTITVVIPDSVAVTNVSKLTMSTWTGSGDVTASDSLCVYRAAGGNYGVTLTGSGPGGAFVVSRSGDNVPLQMSWSAGGAPTVVSSGVQYTFGNAFASSYNCNNGVNNNATVFARVLNADMMAAAFVGLYTGTITIKVVTL